MTHKHTSYTLKISFVNHAVSENIFLSCMLLHEYGHASMRGCLHRKMYRPIVLTLPVAEPRMAKAIVPKALLLPVDCKTLSLWRCIA